MTPRRHRRTYSPGGIWLRKSRDAAETALAILSLAMLMAMVPIAYVLMA